MSAALQHRIISCRDFKPEAPSMDMAFKFAYMMKFWLDMNPRHVAVVYCADGVRLTSFFVSCYLAYSSPDLDTMQALGIFGQARLRGDIALPNTWRFLLLHMNAMLQREARGADRICLAKVFLRLPEALASSDLSLEVIENGVAVFDSQNAIESSTVSSDGDFVSLAPMLLLQVRAFEGKRWMSVSASLHVCQCLLLCVVC
jgi:hypothetical protein